MTDPKVKAKEALDDPEPGNTPEDVAWEQLLDRVQDDMDDLALSAEEAERVWEMGMAAHKEGHIGPMSDVVPDEEVGEIRSPDGVLEYVLETCGKTHVSIVRSRITGRSFRVTWQGLVEIAKSAGIDESAVEENR